MQIIHEKTGFILGREVVVAKGLQKMRGLMFIENMGPNDGMFFSWRNSVHNCFVKFPIDVIFINRKNTIVKILRNLQPWQFTRIYFSARHTIELPGGKIPTDVKEGDTLKLA